MMNLFGKPEDKTGVQAVADPTAMSAAPEAAAPVAPSTPAPEAPAAPAAPVAPSAPAAPAPSAPAPSAAAPMPKPPSAPGAAPVAPKAAAPATPSVPAPAAPKSQMEMARTAAAPTPQKKAEGGGGSIDHAQALRNSIIAGNIPQVVMYGISYALHIGASDIHIEPLEKTVRIRFRVDGVLRHIVEYPHNIHPAVISRIKIMSNMKIDEQRVPQDGRTQVTTEDGREIDLRVSSLPTVNGEKIVMRLQDKTKHIPDLPELGLGGTTLEKMERFTKLPNGIILVTGPTGSGKTNTLYSVLSRLNQVGVNIMTFEDPVEYQMDGLNQSQMRPEIEYSFAQGLRTALRQDPDIIMVGEIRDQETIEIAIRAALTGHLVLSTIHTNSAVATLTRIMDMKVKTFLITSTIRGIISQRLVRTVCKNCKEEYEPDQATKDEIKKTLGGVTEKDLDLKMLENIKLYKGKGCAACGDMGYKGRTAVFEILEMATGVASLVIKEATDVEMEEEAKREGMLTLKQDGFIKCLRGFTTMEEVFRITQ